jgi:hypothetical protein
MGHRFAALAVAGLGLMVVAVSSGVAAQEKRPALLCLLPTSRETYGTQDLKPPERVARELRELGFERGWHVGWDDLTPEYLRQFNAVLLYDIPCTTPGHIDPKTEQQLAMLRGYVEDGGGLWLSEYPYNRSKIEVQNALLAPWGGRILWELAKDDATLCTLQPPCPALQFCWTNAITRSPLTEGVRGLYYGIDFWEPGSPNTCPIEVNSDWQVLARGMPTAASFMVNPSAIELAGPGSIASAPALLAVRQCGKGRVVLWPMSLVYTLMDGYHWMLEGGVVMQGRPPDRPSDGARLTYNLLKWLVEPSVAAGMGGYVYQPPPSPPREAEPGFQEIDWSQVRPVSPLYPHAFAGLIGAQTALSSGTGAPEEFIASAKHAGYQFIAFTEDLERLNAAGWDKLVAACKAGTDAGFAAIPGLYYRTVYGVEYVTFGDLLIYPKPDWLRDVEGKRRLRENDCFVRGLSDTPPIIMVYPRRNPRPLRVNAQFYGFATHTYEAGKLVDESFTSYLELAREGLMLYPLAAHFVRTPEEVAQAREAGMQTYIRAESPSGVVRSVQGMHQGRNPIGWCKPSFVSSGPEVQYFYADNWGTADLAVRNGDRHRVQLMAHSDAGIREVKLYDHTQAIRRFLPGGAKDLTLNVDGFHDRQHAYVAQVTDTQGRTAITWSRTTQVQECSHDMCGDNWNDMPTGKYNNDSGGGHLRGTECQVNGRADILMWPSVINQMGDGYAALKRSGMVCRFGWDLFYSLDHVYDGPGQPGIAYDSRAVVPNSWFEGEVRQRYFARRPPGPHLTVLEGRIKLRRDIEMKGSPGIAFVTMKGSDQLIVPARNGMATVIRHPGRPEFSYFGSAPLAAGEYVSVSALPATVFALEDGMSYGVWWSQATGGRPWAFVGVGQAGETMRAGTEVKWRLAVLSATDAEGDYPYAKGYYPFMEGSNVLSEMVQKRMGLVGKPAYEVRPVVGKVESTRLVLQLVAQDSGWRGLITKAQLPVPLPVYVSGLNPKWSAGVWYKGRNVLLSPEWPPFDEYGFGCWTRNSFVVPRERTDEIQRFPVVDGIGYLELDTEDADRDVFIGNLVVCDNPDLWLTFIRDPKRTYVEVHNPTDATIKATVRAAPGFDLFGPFEEPVQVPAGTSVTVDVA